MILRIQPKEFGRTKANDFVNLFVNFRFNLSCFALGSGFGSRSSPFVWLPPRVPLWPLFSPDSLKRSLPSSYHSSLFTKSSSAFLLLLLLRGDGFFIYSALGFDEYGR